MRYILFCLFLLITIALNANSKETLFKSHCLKSRVEYPDSINRNGLFWVAGSHVALYTGGLVYLNHVWYKDRDKVPFHFYNDIAGYNQIDKFGHATTAFVESNFSYYSLRKVGVPKNKALIIGGSMGFLMQLPIEIADGLNEGWGFSWGDIAANTMGSVLMATQEYFFDNQIVLMKFSYWPTVYAEMANGYLGNKPLEGLQDDYNGHTYWFSANINSIIKNDWLPPWLNIATGYSAGGMFGEFENITQYNGVIIPETQRYRQFFLSLDVDWTKIPTNSTFLEVLFRGLNIIKVPFPALQFNTKGELRGHWIYF